MADENDAGAIGAVATPEMPAPKKQRKPRRLKTAAEASALESPATIVKSPKLPRKKRVEKSDTPPTAVKTSVDASLTKERAIKGSRKARAVPQAAPPAHATTGEAMADLVQLEEENRHLRKALAEKLRQENADLRKRLAV